MFPDEAPFEISTGARTGAVPGGWSWLLYIYRRCSNLAQLHKLPLQLFHRLYHVLHRRFRLPYVLLRNSLEAS